MESRPQYPEALFMLFGLSNKISCIIAIVTLILPDTMTLIVNLSMSYSCCDGYSCRDY